MQTRPVHEAAIQLKAGESLFVYLEAGSTIASTAGQLCLTGAPRWLGEQVFRSHGSLVQGDTLHIESSGWVTLTAAHDGSTVNICRAETPSLLMDWLRKTASLWLTGRTARTCA